MFLAAKRPPRRQTTQAVHLPAPTGGLNTIDAGSATPPGDCVYAYNVIGAEQGLRARLGFQEWVTGMTGATDNTVRSVIPFVGSHLNGSTNKLFATTSTGIWDCSSSGAVTTAWASTTAYAVDQFVTASSTTYGCVTAGTSGSAALPSVWAALTAYSTNAKAINSNNVYICTSGGTSAASGGPTGTGTGIADGSAVWSYVSASSAVTDGSVVWAHKPSNTAPSKLVTFGTQTGDAGYGMSTVCATPAGRFLVYCDEENGLYIYPETTATWAKVAVGVTQLWASSTAYTVGNQVVNGGKVYVVTVAGTSASSGGPTGTGSGITDGTVTWNYVGASSASVIGPSLADQQAAFTADPSNFVFATVWKSRLWFVEKNSSRGWYLDVNSVYGTATSFDFGSRMRSGGPLVGLYNWSYDGGNGMDTLLVGISTAGDVVIYAGTNPNSASTFGLTGCWYTPGVPYGRRITTEYGGDIVIMGLRGVVPLSQLVLGKSPFLDSSQYATAKIANLFSQLASTYGTLQGWGVYTHPSDNALIVAYPTATAQATSQLAMSFVTKGWSQYRALPLLSAGVWAGGFYFGTADGRLCISTGYVDNVLLSNSNSYTPVAWSVLPAYQSGGDARLKQVKMLRANMVADTPSPVVQVTAKYDFDSTEPSPPVGSGTSLSGTWNNATWNSSVWGGDYTPTATLVGATGMGRYVSAAIQGNAITRTTLVGVDVFFEEGGLM